MDYFVTADYYVRHPGVMAPEDQEAMGPAKRAVSLPEFLELVQELPEDEKDGLPPEPTPGFYELSPDGLKSMMKSAARVSNQFTAHAMTILTPERAKEIREIRCKDRHSWRAVAAECYDRWDGSWEPRTNQLMGMALCEVAGDLLEEDIHELPWNDL